MVYSLGLSLLCLLLRQMPSRRCDSSPYSCCFAERHVFLISSDSLYAKLARSVSPHFLLNYSAGSHLPNSITSYGGSRLASGLHVQLSTSLRVLWRGFLPAYLPKTLIIAPIASQSSVRCAQLLPRRWMLHFSTFRPSTAAAATLALLISKRSVCCH